VRLCVDDQSLSPANLLRDAGRRQNLFHSFNVKSLQSARPRGCDQSDHPCRTEVALLGHIIFGEREICPSGLSVLAPVPIKRLVHIEFCMRWKAVSGPMKNNPHVDAIQTSLSGDAQRARLQKRVQCTGLYAIKLQQREQRAARCRIDGRARSMPRPNAIQTTSQLHRSCDNPLQIAQQRNSVARACMVCHCPASKYALFFMQV
jgi:hypothetical protein